MGARECDSGYERCDSHKTSIREFYKGLSEAEILGKFQLSARQWVQMIVNRSALPNTPVQSGAPSAVVADLIN